MIVTEERFDELVGEAIDRIPAEFAQFIEDVVFLVEDQGDDPDIMGLYDGVPLTLRDSGHAGELPDRIFIYRLAICAECDSEQDVIREVTITVVHEIAHHFGIGEERLWELGWD